MRMRFVNYGLAPSITSDKRRPTIHRDFRNRRLYRCTFQCETSTIEQYFWPLYQKLCRFTQFNFKTVQLFGTMVMPLIPGLKAFPVGRWRLELQPEMGDRHLGTIWRGLVVGLRHDTVTKKNVCWLWIGSLIVLFIVIQWISWIRTSLTWLILV